MTDTRSASLAAGGVRSQDLFARAVNAMPGGVSSPVRAFGAVGGTPLFIDSARGARLTDVDGRSYLDFVMSWGPLILGHANPDVVQAVQLAAERGTSYGAPHLAELELAELVAKLYPGIERVRFTSSGTEAAQSALRLARGVTGRDRIVKFAGCYHGHSDGLLVEAGSGAATFGHPSSAGVPSAIAGLTSVLPLDDLEAARRLMAKRGSEVAAIVIEPVPANNGLLPQRPEFLAGLRELATEHGALLLFDEVISGFRVGLGGVAQRLEIQPDLVVLGKIIGGGLPCGAFAGPAAHLEQVAPRGSTYHAGTLSGNPLAMAAGLATLGALLDGRVYQKLDGLAARLEEGVLREIRDHSYPVRWVRDSSMFWLHWAADEPPRRADRVAAAGADLYKSFFHASLQRGVHLAPSAYEVGFVSAAHTDDDIDHAVQVFGEALEVTFRD